MGIASDVDRKAIHFGPSQQARGQIDCVGEWNDWVVLAKASGTKKIAKIAMAVTKLVPSLLDKFLRQAMLIQPPRTAKTNHGGAKSWRSSIFKAAP